MKRSAIDFGVVLHEVILLDNSPVRVGEVLAGLGILLGHILPSKESPILTDGVNLTVSPALCMNVILTDS